MQLISTSQYSLCLLLLPIVQGLSVASNDSLLTFESQNHQMRFSYPAGFIVGSYDTTYDVTGHFRKQIVLVDPKELGNYSQMAIPVGDLPTISIGLELDTAGILLKPFTEIDIVKKFFSVDIKEAEFKKSIGDNVAFRLPGYPGPSGQSAYFYLLPMSNGRYVELTAHRYFFKKTKNPRTGKYPDTEYDKVIEKIIETLTMYTVQSDSVLVGFSLQAGQWIEPLDEFYRSDIDIEASLNAGKILVVRLDLNGDNVDEYFVRTLCGNGGCEYAIFDGRTGRLLGNVFGSEVWLLRQTIDAMPVIESFSHVSASAGSIVRYQFNGTVYEDVSSRQVIAGEETELMYKELYKAPRIK